MSQCQAWKANKHAMGDVRPYDPEPPQPKDDIKLGDYELKLANLECINPDAKSFREKFKIEIPVHIRGRLLILNKVAYVFARLSFFQA